MFAYIGCRTTKERHARGKGISVYAVTGSDWTHIQTVPMVNPSYLAFDMTKQYLYTVHGDGNAVSSFRINDDGTLTALNIATGVGKNPVYITTAPNNAYMYVASLQGGQVSSLPINEDGSLGPIASAVHLAGHTASSVSHAHQCELDRTGRFLLVPTQGRHIGYERVYSIAVNHTTGMLEEVTHTDARTYAEPRHLTVTADNRHVYLVNEKGNAVTFYDYDGTTGSVVPRQILSSLPDTYTGQGQASAIILHPNETFLYATNRIHESVAIYKRDVHTGYLHTIGFTDVRGKTPRFATFIPHTDTLLVANEDSNTLELFNADETTGTLHHTGVSIPTPSPTSVLFK